MTLMIVWKWITSKFGAILAGVSVGIILIVAIFRVGWNANANKTTAKTAKTIIKTVKKGKAIETANRNSGADARRKRLRKYSSNPK